MVAFFHSERKLFRVTAKRLLLNANLTLCLEQREIFLLELDFFVKCKICSGNWSV